MWKRVFVWLTLVATVVLIMASCAPKPIQPTPISEATGLVTPQVAAPTITAPTAVATTPATEQITPTVSSADAAWAKIIDAAKKEGTVNVYGETLRGDVGLAVSKAFKNRYGITVEIQTTTAGGLVERLKTENRMGQVVGDFTESSPTVLGNMNNEGLLASTGDFLPILQEKGVWLIDPTAHDPERKAYLIWRVAQQFPYINTRLVKQGEAPTSWKDMLDPKWRGKMLTSNPSIDVAFYQLLVPMMRKQIWDEEYVRSLLKQELRFTVSSPAAFNELSKGDSAMYLSGPDAGAAPFIKEGAPIQAIDLKEGLSFSGPSMAAVKGGPHPNATLLFLNWLLEPEGQTTYGKTRANRMIRNDLPDFRVPGSFVKVTNPIITTLEDSSKANQLFKEKYVDKLMGR